MKILPTMARATPKELAAYESAVPRRVRVASRAGAALPDVLCLTQRGECRPLNARAARHGDERPLSSAAP